MGEKPWVEQAQGEKQKSAIRHGWWQCQRRKYGRQMWIWQYGMIRMLHKRYCNMGAEWGKNLCSCSAF